MRSIIVLGIAGYLLALPAEACTTVSIPQSPEKVMGKSYDWSQGHGMVVVNKRNVRKSSFRFFPDQTAAKWTSKYGSVSFNQHGREFPLGGINERGLAIEIMWLDSSIHPKPGEKPVINEVQWIQYQLDNFATVREMVEHKNDVVVAPVYAKVHYLACDPSGECASFEYIDGKMVSHSGDEMPVNTLANSTYAESLKHLALYKGFGGELPTPQSSNSLHRFVRATALAKKYSKGEGSPVDYMFGILDNVGPTDNSKFHIVYETKTRQVHFRTRGHFKIKSLDADRFDYRCDGWKTTAIDMNAKLEGNITEKLHPYTRKLNKRIVDESLSLVGGGIPQSVVEKWIAYPETLECMN